MGEEDSVFDVARKTIYWTLIIFVITMVILAFWFTIGNFRSKATYLPLTTKAELLSQRFINSPDCFAYLDTETGQVLGSTIDVTKFIEERINSCYQEDVFKGMNFQFTLETIGGQKTIVKTEDWYTKPDLTLPPKAVRIITGPSAEMEGKLTITVQEKI